MASLKLQRLRRYDNPAHALRHGLTMMIGRVIETHVVRFFVIVFEDECEECVS